MTTATAAREALDYDLATWSNQPDTASINPKSLVLTFGHLRAIRAALEAAAAQESNNARLSKELAECREAAGDLLAFLSANIDSNSDDGNIEIKATQVHADSLCALMNALEKTIR